MANFEQPFGPAMTHRADSLDPSAGQMMRDAIGNLIDQVLVQVPEDPAGLIAAAKPRVKSAILTAVDVQLAIIYASVPTPSFTTYIDGSCENLPGTTINLINFSVTGAGGFGLKISDIPVISGIGVDCKISGVVSPGEYPPAHHCDTYPAYLAHLAEVERIRLANERYKKAYEQWLRDMKAYKLMLRETGTAFNPDGTAKPTPQWPEGVDIERPYPPAPPMGTCKRRRFYVLWTIDVAVTIAVATGVYKFALPQIPHEVRTPCCPPE